MPAPCSKSPFTGRHEIELAKAVDEQGNSYEVARCFFCHAPAPAEEAARATAARDLNRRIKKNTGIRTDDQIAATATREVKKKAAGKLV